MKLGVQKLQEGGFMTYDPTPPVQSPMQETAPTGNTEEKGTIQGIDKDLMKSLIGHGLSNDVVMFKQQVDQAYSRYSNMSVAEKESVVGRRLRQVMSGDFAQINAMIVNKEDYNKAAENVKANLAESEYAVTNNGMIVMDGETGKVGQVSFQEYSKSKDKLRPLTNAELMRIRANDPSLAFDTQSISILNNAVGMATLRKRVIDVIGSLGKYDGPGMTSKDGSTQYGHSVVKAVASMQKQINEGTYDAALSSNDQNIAIATNAILGNLNNNERAVLFARAAVSGATTQEEFASFAAKSIGDLLNMNLSTSVDFTKGPSSKDGKETKTEVGYYQQMFNASGSPVAGGTTLNFGNGFDLKVAAVRLPGMTGVDGKPLGTSMLTNNRQLLSVVNPKAFMFGDKQLDEGTIDNIMYEGGAVEVFRAPAIQKNGQLIPDIHRIENYYNVQKEIARSCKAMGVKILPVEAEARILRRFGFTERKLEDIRTSKFGTTFAVTYRNNVEGVDENLVTEMEGSSADKYKAVFDKQHQYNGAATSKANRSGRADYTNTFGWGSGDNLIRSRITFAIPEKSGIQGRMIDGEAVTTTLKAGDVNADNGGNNVYQNDGNDSRFSSSRLNK